MYVLMKQYKVPKICGIIIIIIMYKRETAIFIEVFFVREFTGAASFYKPIEYLRNVFYCISYLLTLL